MKTYFKSALLLGLAFAIYSNDVFGQGQPVTDINGTVLREQSYTEVTGSPYLVDKWTRGSVRFVNGKTVADVALKYDQVKDELMFAGKEDKEYYFNDPVKEFSIIYIKDDMEFKALFRSGYLPVKNLTNKSFYEVLLEGKAQLLRKNIKTIMETKEYNSATVNKKISDNIGFYIAKGEQLMAVQKNDVKTIAEFIDSSKAPALIEYADKNKLNLKRELDLRNFVGYYNSL